MGERRSGIGEVPMTGVAGSPGWLWLWGSGGALGRALCLPEPQFP